MKTEHSILWHVAVLTASAFTPVAINFCTTTLPVCVQMLTVNARYTVIAKAQQDASKHATFTPTSIHQYGSN
jgi:hypothetical protein